MILEGSNPLRLTHCAVPPIPPIHHSGSKSRCQTPLPVQTKPMSCNSTIYNMDYTWLWSTINGMMQLPLSRSPTEQSSFGQQTKACLVPVLAHGTDRFSALAASLAKFTSKVT